MHPLSIAMSRGGNASSIAYFIAKKKPMDRRKKQQKIKASDNPIPLIISRYCRFTFHPIYGTLLNFICQVKA